MKRLFLTATIAMAFAVSVTAQNVKATVHADKAGAKINKEIYGQFSEHLFTVSSLSTSDHVSMAVSG